MNWHTNGLPPVGKRWDTDEKMTRCLQQKRVRRTRVIQKWCSIQAKKD